MHIWQALILGIVQGLTEFLPVSSSAHLLLLQQGFGWDIPQSQEQAFDVALHIGTLIALIAYFRHDLLGILGSWARSLGPGRGRSSAEVRDESTGLTRGVEARLGWLIILGTIPALVMFKLFETQVNHWEHDPIRICWALILFSGVFWIAERVGTQRKDVEGTTPVDAALIGVGQGLALFSGLSRSGSTICTGLFLGFNRAAAARFSFLLSAPVVLAATLKELPELAHASSQSTTFFVATIIGFLASMISGFLAISWLLGFVRSHSLTWFALWRVPVGIIGLLWFTTH